VIYRSFAVYSGPPMCCCSSWYLRFRWVVAAAGDVTVLGRIIRRNIGTGGQIKGEYIYGRGIVSGMG
jgi:hypothetical protein